MTTKPETENANLRAALANATQGEWRGCHDGNCECGSIYSVEGDFVLARVNLNHEEDATQVIPKEVYTANAKFIALAHNELPALLTALETALAENGRLRTAANDLCDACLPMIPALQLLEVFERQPGNSSQRLRDCIQNHKDSLKVLHAYIDAQALVGAKAESGVS